MGFFSDYFNFFGNLGESAGKHLVPADNKILDKLVTDPQYHDKVGGSIVQGSQIPLKGKKGKGKKKRKP